MKSINIYLPNNIQEWLHNWLEFQREMPNQGNLENETVRIMFNIMNRTQIDDFVLFNNAGGHAFEIWETSVKQIIKEGNEYLYCSKVNGVETIHKYFVWNRPRTYLNYFRVTPEDIKRGFITFEDNTEEEVEIFGKYIRNFPMTGKKKR